MLRLALKTQILKIFHAQNAPFKILILDERTKEILSPLFKVSDLREAGICNHFLITDSRTSAKKIPAIYYVKDFKLITEDVCRILYSSYFINSTVQIGRADLQNLAVKMSRKQQANRILAVNDTFTDFIPLFDDFFSFNLPNSLLNEYNRETVTSLFSLFVTINENPFIVGNPLSFNICSQILKMLDNKIKTTKIIKNTIKRPLLILLEREIDFITPLMHTMGFLELINDVFNIDLNKVDVDGMKINLDADSDFLKRERFHDFPTVVDQVEKDVLAYKKEIAARNINESSEISKMLENAPDLQRKNEIVNNLLNISVKAVSEVKERKLDEFYSMERNFNQDELMELTDNGTENDIIRLCASMVGSKNADLIPAILSKRKINSKILDYIKQFSTSENTLKSRFTSTMKNILFKKSIPIVNCVEDVLSKIRNDNINQFYETSSSSGSLYLNEISQVVVFIDGGACYTELKYLKELEAKYKIPFILGGTENLNADKFIRQIKKAIE
ncbi:hypothetical protein NUSPORA_01638 [Nucleospora cyclopteri]